MSKSKRLFFIISIIFIILLVLIAIDFSSRTHFPGNKKPSVEQKDDSTTLN